MTSAPIRGIPPPLQADLDTSTRDHGELVKPIDDLAALVHSRLNMGYPSPRLISSVLRAMQDTDGSIRAILVDAKRIDSERGPCGRHYDAVLLARPQLDATFIGLLLLKDEKHYRKLYEKACWASEARRVHYDYLQAGDTPAGQAWWKEQRPVLQEMARRSGITPEEEHATLADLRGVALTDAQRNHVVRPLATPGKLVKQRLLAGTRIEALGDLLWRRWQFLCDPTHVGLRSVMVRRFLRGDSPVLAPGLTRETAIAQEVVHNSLLMSIVAITSLATAITVTWYGGDELLKTRCSDAWDAVQGGNAFAAAIWNGWARDALGILAPRR